MADQSAITLEEFKARLPLVDIVARHVRLIRRGREHLGLCPFHQEKTPSFTVSEGKGFYHCFGCGQHGNAIDFVMALEGLDFSQAVQRLAELTGLPAPRRGGEAAPAVDQTLYAANAAATRWFAGRLESASGAAAAAYLAGRGLDQETILRFGLGYAPDDRTALKRALQAEGYPEASLLEAGLLIRPEDGGPSYDRFRQRVIFPIHDRRGRVVGFGGRALGEARAKYLNTADTPLFHKGELLYGLALARPAVRERGTVIVAEGYMDVIALAQAGFANAVAPLGTAVSEAQLALLWQLADEPLVCLDSDEAGLRAAHRLIERALPLLKPGKSLRFALLPAGQDPDSLLRAAGREALARRLDDAAAADRVPVAARARRPQLRHARASGGVLAALPRARADDRRPAAATVVPAGAAAAAAHRVRRLRAAPARSAGGRAGPGPGGRRRAPAGRSDRPARDRRCPPAVRADSAPCGAAA